MQIMYSFKRKLGVNILKKLQLHIFQFLQRR